MALDAPKMAALSSASSRAASDETEDGADMGAYLRQQARLRTMGKRTMDLTAIQTSHLSYGVK